MTEQTIEFELVSPEEKLISEPVAMATIPGEEGEFGVLAGHSSLVASLRPGVVKLANAEGKEVSIFITGGFADVSAEICTVLAEEAVDVQDLDKAELEQELANLNEDLGMAEGEIDTARVQKQIDMTEAKLAAVA